MSLPTDSEGRKDLPIATGVLDYFPDALAEVARCSKKGNDKHNPGEPLHWAREKSDDHPDCLIRHFMERGTYDEDGILHSIKVVWRALAIAQLEIEVLKTEAANFGGPTAPEGRQPWQRPDGVLITSPDGPLQPAQRDVPVRHAIPEISRTR